MPVCTSSKISSRPLLVAQLAQRLEERMRRGAHAALALHRLDQDARGVRTDRLLDRFEIAMRHLVEAVQRRPEAFEIFGGAGRGQRAQRARRGTRPRR